MTSIFLENYEYKNEESTNFDLMWRYKETLISRWDLGYSSGDLICALDVLEERLKEEAERIILKELIKFCTGRINQHYLHKKNRGISGSELTDEYVEKAKIGIDLFERFYGELKEKWRSCKKPTEFYLEAMKNLRCYEEDIHNILNAKELS